MCGTTTQMLLVSAVMITAHSLRTEGGLILHVAGNSSKRFLRLSESAAPVLNSFMFKDLI